MCSRAELRDIIYECGGIISDIARHFGVVRPTIYKWIDKKDLRKDLELAREEVDDECFISMREMIRDNDKWAIKTWLHLRGHLKSNSQDNDLAPENHADVVASVNQAIRESNERNNHND